MSRLVTPSNHRPGTPRARPRPAALRFLAWLWPSLLAGFAVVGFLVIQLAAVHSGELVLTERSLASLRTIGLCVTVITTGVRIALWPPPTLKSLVRRLG